MVKLTKAQRQSLKAVFDRSPIEAKPIQNDGYYGISRKLTYKQFRETVRFGSGCIMVPWKGMWLGIEPDGYTHS